MVPGVAGFWGSYFGYVGYGDIQQALITAKEEGLEQLILDWDSPGGSARQVEETSDLIKQIASEIGGITSFTSGTAASAALWLATSADHFYTTKMVDVGSVGAVMVVVEYTKMMAEDGVTPHVIKSTPLKAVGSPYEKLSEEGRKELQRGIDEAHKFFVEALAVNINSPIDYVEEKIANGKTWSGEDAHRLGLTNGLQSFDDVFLALSRKTSDNANKTTFSKGTNEMKKLSKQAQDLLATGELTEAQVVDQLGDAAYESDAEGAGNNVAGGAGGDTPEAGGEGGTDVGGGSSNLNAEGGATDTTSEAEGVALTLLSEQLKEANDKITELSVALADEKTAHAAVATELSAAQGDAQGDKSIIKSMSRIVAVATQVACVKTGSAIPEMESLLAMEPQVLVAQCEAAQKGVEKAFPGGRVTKETGGTDPDLEGLQAPAEALDALYQDAAQV